MTNQDQITKALDAVLLSIDNIQSRLKYENNKVWICMNNSWISKVLQNNLSLAGVKFRAIGYMSEDPFTIELECEDVSGLIRRYEGRGIPCTA